MSISLNPLLHACKRCAEALLAQDCLLCQGASAGQLLCRDCARELPRAATACPRCAAPASSDAECGACLAAAPHYDASHAAFAYAYPADALVRALKYDGQLALAAWFARELRQRIGASAQADLIVPLPLHPARLAERGFNQAAEVAKALARLYRLPLHAQLAQRVRNTAPQTALPWKERARNMRAAFACSRDLKGLRIAVVDDVMTSGATLNEFARTLKASGAARVENWVLARTARNV